MKINRNKSFFKSAVILMAISTLMASYITGNIKKGKETLVLLNEQVSSETEFNKINDKPFIFEALDPNSKILSSYYVLTSAHGWGGPLLTASIFNSSGILTNIIVLEHKETLSFFYRLERNNFFKQFKGKKLSDPFIPDKDIDTVTQATSSSKAFTSAIRNASHALGKNIFHLSIKEEKIRWRFGFNELALILLYAGTIVSLFKKNKILRYICMVAAFILLGFYLNSSLSITHFASLLLGYFPSLMENTFWWILVTGAILTAFLMRKNLYCYGICPFGNFQEFNSKISGVNIVLSKQVTKYVRNLVYVVAWLALVIILLTKNSTLGSYEPFPTLFSLQGLDIQWFILPAVVIGSFVLNRFFCQFFCPVGVILNLIIKSRIQLTRLFAGHSNGKIKN